MVFENHLIQAADGLPRIWFGAEFVDYFPMTMSTLWIEWRLWHMNAVGYHVTNIILHALNAVLLWQILNRLKIPAAWWAALIFAIHPVNVESVAWITERKNTLSFFFLTLSALLYLRFESLETTAKPPISRKLYYLSLIAFALSLLAKTSGVMLPFVLLGLAYWQRGKLAKSDLLRSLPYFGVALALALVTIWFQYNKAITDTVINTNTFSQRLISAGWAVWFYLGKALLPLNLIFVYPRWTIDAHNFMNYLPGVAVFLVLVTLWFLQKKFGRGPFVAFSYFVVTLFPILGFLNIYFQRYSFVADHWQYISIIGIIALLSGGLATLLKNNATFPLAAIAAACSFLTWKQTHIYKNQESLWRDTLKKNPACWMAEGNWGLWLFNQGRVQDAIAHYRAGLAIKADDEGNLHNLGVALLQSGNAAEAVDYFEKTLAINPNHKHALGNLAFIRAIDKNPALRNGPEAVRLAQRAVELTKEEDEWNLDTLAAAYAETGNFPEAIKAQNKAIAVATSKNLNDAVQDMQNRLKLYQAGKPYHPE